MKNILVILMTLLLLCMLVACANESLVDNLADNDSSYAEDSFDVSSQANTTNSSDYSSKTEISNSSEKATEEQLAEKVTAEKAAKEKAAAEKAAKEKAAAEKAAKEKAAAEKAAAEKAAAEKAAAEKAAAEKAAAEKAAAEKAAAEQAAAEKAAAEQAAAEKAAAEKAAAKQKEFDEEKQRYEDAKNSIKSKYESRINSNEKMISSYRAQMGYSSYNESRYNSLMQTVTQKERQLELLMMSAGSPVRIQSLEHEISSIRQELSNMALAKRIQEEIDSYESQNRVLERQMQSELDSEENRHRNNIEAIQQKYS